MKQMDRIEWKLDQILLKMSEAHHVSPVLNQTSVVDVKPEVVLHPFTTKQHAVLQMVVRGAPNAEIGERLLVTENTAKVHVRTIAKKLGVKTRQEITLKVIDALKEIDSETYIMLSGGIPKDWDGNYVKGDDPYDHLLVPKEVTNVPKIS